MIERPVVGLKEAQILLHHYKVEALRWSEEEPVLRFQAQGGVEYWTTIVDRLQERREQLLKRLRKNLLTP